MQLKTLDTVLAVASLVKDRTEALEKALTDVRAAVSKLPESLREPVSMEIYDIVDAWLSDIDGHSASRSTQPSIPTGPPVVQRNSLAAKAVAVLQAGPLSMGDLVNTLKTQGVPGSEGDSFRAVLNTALWRRKDVFERDGSVIRLVSQEVELED